MSDIADDAKNVAAKATGLRPDQVEAAVNEYRKAADALHAEPDWRALSHWSFRDGTGTHQYTDPDGVTAVVLQIECGKRSSERLYVLGGKAYESFGEARTAELLKTAKPKPRALR